MFSDRFGQDAHSHSERGAKLLDELAKVPAHQRDASFRTVAMVVWPDGRELAVEGVCAGWIAAGEHGDGGFGYDPVFVPIEGDGRTFAQMNHDEKHALSHRGRALRSLAADLQEDDA